MEREWLWLGTGKKVQGLEGNFHPSKFETALTLRQTQGKFSTLDLTQVFEEISNNIFTPQPHFQVF